MPFPAAEQTMLANAKQTILLTQPLLILPIVLGECEKRRKTKVKIRIIFRMQIIYE